MLVSRHGDRLVLVTQPDHGALAGELAAHWGSARFAAPAAHEALLLAATHHDDGWRELDCEPAFNPAKGRPALFVELALERTAEPYARNIEALYKRDLRAGALVGMHLSGFYTGRWGLGGGPSGNPAAMEVVARQEARWMPALREAWAYRGPRSAFDAETWHAYEVLQALDLISLALGLIDLDPPSGEGDSIAVTGTLGSLDQPDGGRIIPMVPVSAGGEYADLTLRVTAPGHVTLEPFPFSAPRLELSWPVRRLEDRRYGSDGEAATAFRSAPAETVSVVVGAPEPAGLSSGVMAES